jgi:hypothetical protein
MPLGQVVNQDKRKKRDKKQQKGKFMRMDASIKLQDGLHFSGTTDSGFSVELDAKADDW